MYELLFFILLSLIFESGMGILYGVGIGYEPIMVFSAAILINLITIVIAVSVVDRVLNWKRGLKDWIERRLARGRKLIDKYGCVGIVMGVCFLSPMQLAIVGRLVGMKPSRLYPSLMVATCLVATAYLGVAVGVFKFLLA
ncbi:MAG: small multi-drug export protein [Candidatus Bathyarchaeota archaeon]|nr:small multi-drug export protein [Candidatus Bathyarchaeota archaeon]